MDRHPDRNRRLALLQIHLAVLLAGGTGLFGKLVTVSPAVITCGRTLVGTLALGLVVYCLKINLRVAQTRSFFLLVLSGVALAIHWLTFFHSIQVSTVAIGVLAFATFPLMVTFLEPIFFREKLHGSDVATAVVVTAGLALVTPALDLANRLTQGVLWGLLSAFACAIVALLSRSSCRVYPAVTVGFYQQGITAICTLPFAWQSNDQLTTRNLLLLLLLGLLFTAVLQVLVLTSLRHLKAQTASIMFGLEPVYGVIFAWLLLSETPAARTIYGGALICGAIVWTSLQGKGGGRSVAEEKLTGAA